MSDAPGAGWYPDPNDAKTNRYWDGSQWTESRAPIAGVSAKEERADGVIIWGYIFAVIIPIVGFIIGLTQISKNRHGIWVVLASVAAFIIWFALLSAAAEPSHTGGYYR